MGQYYSPYSSMPPDVRRMIDMEYEREMRRMKRATRTNLILQGLLVGSLLAHFTLIAFRLN